MVNSKQKGASFERECCRLLSLWVSRGKYTDCLWRSAMSGGRSTVAQKKGLKLGAQAGDISAVRTEGHKLTDKFAIECKHYSSLELLGVLTGKGRLLKFWHEIGRVAQSHNKEPMLIAKQNRTPTLACLTGVGLALLNGGEPIIIVPAHNLYIVLFAELLKRGNK